MKKPYKIVHSLQKELDEVQTKLLKKYYNIKPGYKLTKYIKGYVVDQCRGHGRKYYYSIPLWAYKRGKDYFTYYIAHELTHMLSGKGHRKQFYDVFKQICPDHLQFNEYDYLKKSKNYGIKMK